MLRSRSDITERTAVAARGGVFGGAVLTGVVVALGAMFLMSALVGGVLTAMGLSAEDVTASGTIQAGLAAGALVIVAQFLAYLWGGYTAGRMSRGAGLANGILVPFVALLVAVLVGAVVASLGATANLNLPWSASRLPLENDFVVDWGVAISIGALAAMLLGGALGGTLGARWHTKLERSARDEAPAAADREVDIRDDRPATPASPVATTTPVVTERAPTATRS